MGACMTSPDQAEGANGLVRKGDRVQTQYTRDEGGDDRWYSGTVSGIRSETRVSIKYDDGEL